MNAEHIWYLKQSNVHYLNWHISIKDFTELYLYLYLFLYIVFDLFLHDICNLDVETVGASSGTRRSMFAWSVLWVVYVFYKVKAQVYDTINKVKRKVLGRLRICLGVTEALRQKLLYLSEKFKPSTQLW